MIIFNGEKYSCVSCIRGHRSSSCKHSDRMLVKVRTRGRPSPLDVRKVILVDKNSRVDVPDGQSQNQGQNPGQVQGQSESAMEDDTEPLCTGMNKQPVLFLRAIATKKALLVDGNLKILVASESSTPDSEVTRELQMKEDEKKFVSEHEFLLQHSTRPTAAACSSCSGKNKQLLSRGDDEFSAGTVSKRLKVENDNSSMDLSIAADGSTIPSSNSNSNGNDNHKSQNPHMFQDSVVQLFTQKGAYLSTTCSCDDNCGCNNCLIHREEEELEKYLHGLQQPLINLGSAHLFTTTNNNKSDHISIQNQDPSETDLLNPINIGANAQGYSEICLCDHNLCECPNCLFHPEEHITLSDILIHGVLHYKWKKKTVIHYKNKAIRSKYWWDFLTSQVPSLSTEGLRSLDLIKWFDNLVLSNIVELPDVNDYGYFSKHIDGAKHINNVTESANPHLKMHNNHNGRGDEDAGTHCMNNSGKNIEKENLSFANDPRAANASTSYMIL
ncbi:metal-binding activator 1 [Kluyveromyces marxianus]|nr:metal-binding activator 1 [Kluyveromyces marxianus]